MNVHLMSQIEQAIAFREAKGWETNVQALTAWFQWAAYPMAEGRGYTCGWDGERLIPWVPHEDEYWFLPVPKASTESEENPSCWITPKGFMWSVGYGYHGRFSTCAGLTYNFMERAGWVHTSGGRLDVFFPLTGLQERAMKMMQANCVEAYGSRGMWVKDEYLNSKSPYDYTGQCDASRWQGLNPLPRKEFDWQAAVQQMPAPLQAPEALIAF